MLCSYLEIHSYLKYDTLSNLLCLYSLICALEKKYYFGNTYLGSYKVVLNFWFPVAKNLQRKWTDL